MPQFTVKGVDKESQQDKSITVDAESAANAKVKAELQGLIVTDVLDTNKANEPDDSNDDPFGDDAPAPAASKRQSHDPHDDLEEPLWSGTPSHLTAFGRYCIGVALIAVGCVCAFYFQWPYTWIIALLGLLYFVWTYLQITHTKYEVTDQRVLITTGIIARHIEEIELFRVKDSQLNQSLIYRILGLGDIRLFTSDATAPEFDLNGIHKPRELRETIRRHVTIMRKKKGVRELDTPHGMHVG